MMLFLYLLVFLLCDNHVHSQINGTSINNTLTEYATLNETYEIKCPQLVNDVTVKLIIWKFANTTIPVVLKDNDSPKFDENDLYESNANGSLIIKTVGYNSSGQYVCSAYGNKILYFSTINVIVRGPPNEIKNFKGKPISHSSLRFSWDISTTESNYAAFFNLTLCQNLITKNCETVNLQYPTLSHDFKALKSYTAYRASIIAGNAVGYSKRVDLSVRTKGGIPTARPFVTNISPGSRNASIQIECNECDNSDKMQGVLLGYVIKYEGKSQSKTFNFTSSNTTQFTAFISGLFPFRNYTVSISVFNGYANGPEDVYNFKTLADFPNPPLYLSTNRITASTIEVIWHEADDTFGPITSYVLKYHEQRSSNNVSFDISADKRNYVIKNLISRTSYMIYLASVNSVGQSSFIPTHVRTDREEPIAPKTVRQFISEGKVRLIWENTMTDNQTVGLTYHICWLQNMQSSQCLDVVPGLTEDRRRNWIDLNQTIWPQREYSSLSAWIRVAVPSDFCGNPSNCLILESSSPRFMLNFTNIHQHKPLQPSLVIVLVISIVLIIIFCSILIYICRKHSPKQLCLPTTAYYVRPPGEYIDVVPRKLSMPKILPLEKTPHLPIPVSNLVEHILKCRADDGAGFQAEFESVENADSSKWFITHAKLKENQMKNRYTNIFPYDHSRVILQNSYNGRSDYINASFVDGYHRSNAYIATQGPLKESIADFWQMVWEQNCEIIVMISNFFERGRCKCEEYWSTKEMIYGNICVRLVFEVKRAFFTERRFKIRNVRNKKNSNKERLVYHYQYTDWRDFDVPPSSLPVLVFIRATVKHWSDNSGPIVVHCSAGVGRTGTYICIESQIRQMEAEHQINVRGFLEHIRQQRMKLVQTESQYTFIHDALYEYFLCPDHEVYKENLSNYIKLLKEMDSQYRMKMDIQFKMCVQFEPSDYEYLESRKRFNLDKNRSEIVPIESRRINLSCEPGIDGSNYINASAVQGYWEMKEFIITQHPLEDTIHDFWKMVWDENCSVMVLLSDEDLSPFWPSSETDARQFRWMRISYRGCEEKNILQYHFLLSSSAEDYAQNCTMYRLRKWPTCVSESAELLRLLFEVNSKRHKSPIVVVDENGGNRAGIFVAMSTLLNQLRNDDVVDVYFVLKMIHFERPHTFSNSTDLELVYELLEHVISNYNSFSFFTRLHNTELLGVVPNGVAHHSMVPSRTTQTNSIINNSTNNSTSNNSTSIFHYATLSTLRSKSSTSTSRRRASYSDSEPLGPNSSPFRSQAVANRTSWNVGETRFGGVSFLTESFNDWSNSVCSSPYSGYAPVDHRNSSIMDTNNSTHPNCVQIISNPIIDLPVARIILDSPSGNGGDYTGNHSEDSNQTNSVIESTTSSSTVWCTQNL